MKEISRTAITERIQKELSEGQNWCKGDFGRYFQIMLDVSDGDIWADVFITQSDWVSYHSDSIVYLRCQYLAEDEEDMMAGYIDDAVRRLKEAGWTITE